MTHFWAPRVVGTPWARCKTKKLKTFAPVHFAPSAPGLIAEPCMSPVLTEGEKQQKFLETNPTSPPPTAAGLIAEPYVSPVLRVPPSEGGILLIASDGLWDFADASAVTQLALATDGWVWPAVFVCG